MGNGKALSVPFFSTLIGIVLYYENLLVKHVMYLSPVVSHSHWECISYKLVKHDLLLMGLSILIFNYHVVLLYIQVGQH